MIRQGIGLFFLCLGPLACGAAAPAAPASSTPSNLRVDSEAPRVGSDRATAQDLRETTTRVEAPVVAAQEAEVPIPVRRGPCPVPSAEVTRLFANAWHLSTSTDAVEPRHAVAEALRLRLDELFQSGCQHSLTDMQLLGELSLLAPALPQPQFFVNRLNASTLMVGTHDTNGAILGLYGWVRGKVRTRIVVTNEGTSMEEQFLLLDATPFMPAQASEPMLALVNTHIWATSCWRTLRLRVLAPSDDPRKPRALLDMPQTGRWCEDVHVTKVGANIEFNFNDWGGMFSDGNPRPYLLSYQYTPDKLTQHFGFLPEFDLLVDDWLESPWKFAQEATVPAARARLEAIHQDLSAKVKAILNITRDEEMPTFSEELFPSSIPTQRRLVVYCATATSKKPCPGWKTVDFTLEQGEGLWRVLDAKARSK